MGGRLPDVSIRSQCFGCIDRWLWHLLQIVNEELCFRAARRRLADILIANAAFAAPQRILALLTALPAPQQLARTARLAFVDIVRQRIECQEQWQAVYAGSGMRVDGGYKVAKRLSSSSLGQRTRPYTALLAFCSTDGSLLAPVRPIRREIWEDIAVVLRPLARKIIAARMRYGLSLPDAVPCFVSTDSFAKHRRLLKQLMREARGKHALFAEVFKWITHTWPPPPAGSFGMCRV